VRALAAALLALAFAGCGGGVAKPVHTAVTGASPTPTVTTTATATTHAGPPAPHPPFTVAQRVLTFVDHSRLVTYPGEAPQPRKLVTIIRYPLAPGRFPLVVFGHGFAVTPALYARLLEAWAQAGYVVAAPLFPLENADAPGGPNEADLVNQPRDMSFVITQMLALDRGTQRPFAGAINPSEIAVAGQSDGGDTALTAAYNGAFRDRRIRAAVILSGQEIPGLGGYDFPSPSPPPSSSRVRPARPSGTGRGMRSSRPRRPPAAAARSCKGADAGPRASSAGTWAAAPHPTTRTPCSGGRSGSCRALAARARPVPEAIRGGFLDAQGLSPRGPGAIISGHHATAGGRR